jgi:HD-GYP domain-containing protein (c-di-GMP phosphodiesterase class II)
MLKRIPVQQLRLGMHIDGFCAPWMDHPFWRNHFVLSDADDIARILASKVAEVWIDPSKGLDVAPDPSAPAVVHKTPAAPPPAPPARDTAPTPNRVEYARAALICNKAKQVVAAIFQEARLGHAVDTVLAQELVQEITDSVLRNPDAMVSLARLKTADDYTYMHSVAVCALMVALSGQLELDEEQTRSMGLAGLLHDMGKAVMPIDVLNKPGKLTDAEFATIQAHPKEGYKILLDCLSANPTALDVVLHHHEKMDGSGYPDGLQGEAISLPARMGAICDVYDAVTSTRPYNKGWDPAIALQRMADWTKGHLDPRLFQAFVKRMGIYPIGALVRLSSGRIGVVTEQNPGSLLKPVVKVFFSTKSDMRIRPELVNLAAPGSTEKITAREDPDYWRFPDQEALWSGFI